MKKDIANWELNKLFDSTFQMFLLKGLFHPACLARVVPWFAFVVAIFMAHENGDKQRLAMGRHVQGMLDETDPLTFSVNDSKCALDDLQGLQRDLPIAAGNLNCVYSLLLPGVFFRKDLAILLCYMEVINVL